MEEIIIENENLLNLLNKAREITGTTYKNNLEDILIALEELEDAYEDMKEEKEISEKIKTHGNSMTEEEAIEYLKEISIDITGVHFEEAKEIILNLIEKQKNTIEDLKNLTKDLTFPNSLTKIQKYKETLETSIKVAKNEGMLFQANYLEKYVKLCEELLGGLQ